MKLGDLNKWFPISNSIVEINAATKKKSATVKIAIPDEFATHLMNLAMGMEVPIDYLVLAYLDKDLQKEKDEL